MTAATMIADEEKPPLGIVAGGGSLPAQLADHCRKSGRPFFVIALEGYADVAALAGVPHAVVRLGAVGESFEQLRAHHARELVLAGHVKRPSFSSLRPDKTGARLLARLSGAFFSGDDAVLKAVVAFLEDEGFTVTGVNNVLGTLTAPAGTLGRVAPDEQARADIALGFRVATALGALDVGQAVIVEHGYVLGVEAAEGTDALIRRCATLKREAKGGVLVKLCKPGQESRVDLPSIGPNTIAALSQAGFRGVALQAGQSLLIDRERTTAEADRLGLFIMGVSL